MADQIFGGDELVKQRNVQEMDPREMRVVESMHFIAQRHNIVLACAHCRQPFTGYNSMTDPALAIVCGCREIRSVNRRHQEAPDPVTVPASKLVN